MKSVVRKMDRAIKRLYNLDHTFNAEAFLLTKPMLSLSGQGAFYVKATDQQEVHVGIFLDATVLGELARFRRWNSSDWNISQIGAFAVAAEEVSHFNYFLHHQMIGRPVSQLEMEIQGEIDKFLLTFLAGVVDAKETKMVERFEKLLELLFEKYRLAENLTAEQKHRYEEANRIAQAFLSKHRQSLIDVAKWEKALALLRRFYRISMSDKVIFTQR